MKYGIGMIRAMKSIRYKPVRQLPGNTDHRAEPVMVPRNFIRLKRQVNAGRPG